MTAKFVVVAMLAGVGLSMSGCDKVKSLIGGKTGGQVVAVVEGHEITSLELRNELSGFSSADPKVMKAARDQALQQIIIRTLLADRAREQKLDKVPQYTLQVRRGQQTLLAQMYESKMFQGVTPPTKQEAENYVLNNPAKFAERRIFILDRIVAPAGALKKEKIAALKTLEELRVVLDQGGIPYQESAAAIDTLTASSETVKGVEKLPPGEVFIFAQGNAWVFNRIASVRSAPFRGDLATGFATEQLRKIQAEDFVRTQIVSMRRAAESKITYSPGYKPDNIDAGIAPVKGPNGETQPAGAGAPGAAAPPKAGLGNAAPGEPK